MAFNIFKKKEEKKETKPQTEEAVQETAAPKSELLPSRGANDVIRHFYASEKASRLMADNQYTFVVAPHATKGDVKKHVGALYKVTVTNVQMMNTAEKQRIVGKYRGEKPGFRKAIVTLKEGQTIESAKP